MNTQGDKGNDGGSNRRTNVIRCEKDILFSRINDNSGRTVRNEASVDVAWLKLFLFFSFAAPLACFYTRKAKNIW